MLQLLIVTRGGKDVKNYITVLSGSLFDDLLSTLRTYINILFLQGCQIHAFNIIIKDFNKWVCFITILLEIFFYKS